MKKIILILITLVGGTIAAYASSPEYLRLAEKADSLIEKEKWTEAEECITNALRLEPANFSNSLLLSNLGIVRNRQQKFDSALESFTLGLAMAPSSTVLRNNRALTWLHLKNYDRAVEDLSESLRIDSLQEWPRQMRGLLFLQNGDMEGAKNDFNFIIEKFPDNSVGWSGLGTIYEIEENYDEALKCLDRALELTDDVETHTSRILFKINREKYSEAKTEINDCLSAYPDEAIFYVLRGYLHKKNFRNEEAQADRKIALDKGIDKQIVDFYIPEVGR